MFEQISESFRLAVSKIRFVDDEKALNNALDVLKKALLKADVHHKVTKELLALIEADLKQSGIGQKQFLDAIKSNLTKSLFLVLNSYMLPSLVTLLIFDIKTYIASKNE